MTSVYTVGYGSLMTNTATKRFPMDGFADTCNGLGASAPMHGTDEELAQGMCKACNALLDAFAIKYPAPVAASCICVTRGHEHGAKYSTCNCCFDD